MADQVAAIEVLIVDDDADGRVLLALVLRGAGYACHLAPDAEEAIEFLSRRSVDVVIADINLPGSSGLELLAWVHERGLSCEGIILTADPQVDTAIRALRGGAVDYLTKPLANADLVVALGRAAVRSRLARQSHAALNLLQEGLKRFAGQAPLQSASPAVAGVGSARNDGPQQQYRVGPVLLDLDRYVLEVNGRPVEATATELEILHFLCRNPDRVVTPQELVQSIRGYQAGIQEAPGIIRPHVSNLRRKLIAIEAEADIIQTVRSMGYRLKWVNDGSPQHSPDSE